MRDGGEENNVGIKNLPPWAADSLKRGPLGLEQCPGQGLGVKFERALATANGASEDMLGSVANKLDALGEGFGYFYLLFSSLAEV